MDLSQRGVSVIVVIHEAVLAETTAADLIEDFANHLEGGLSVMDAYDHLPTRASSVLQLVPP